ncbi:MAG TPA: exo-beta-N-acetylmuramidase NamZ domain-containing protein [Candidatus Binatia bacterium]|nr:exo-beta-N-acetylmuramidase NamZ domain-containing protein [Candidatus Binatia bacterium]
MVVVARIVGVTLLAMLALPAFAFTPPRDVVAGTRDFSGIDEAANEAVASGEIPGVVVLIGRGDDILLHRAYGSRRLLPSPAPMTVDTIFDIASLTKPVGTTLAVMTLVEHGGVKLDAPVGRYLKEFHGKQFDEITIRRLLTHSAGLAAYPPNGAVAAGFPTAAREIARLPLEYPPGSAFQYSDTGFILLGEVVRRVGGAPLDRYLERTVFRPLGLADTTFHPKASAMARVAPTEFVNGNLLRGEVHDQRARLLGGVAGHAGMFSTSTDLARIVQMLLSRGTLNGHHILDPATVREMWEVAPDGRSGRALGWDVTSSFSRTMAPFFPEGSVGHLGFTGTAIWVDPPTRSYLIVLSNRVHPYGGGAARIRDLRIRLAAVAGAQLFQPPVVPDPGPTSGPAADGPSPDGRVPPGEAVLPPERVLTGLDVLSDQKFAMLSGHSVGLVTNQTGIDSRGRRAIDLIAAAPGVRLQAIFSPEHGLTGEADTDVPHGRDFATGRPIWSLYGTTRRPTAAMLKDITLVVFDIQDVGARYYTYLTTLVYVMEEAAKQRIPVLVLDRPNPINGRVVEGPLMDPDLQSFTAPHPIPVRTGMTIGEFGRLAAAERKIPVSLTVVPLVGWDRDRWFDETGLPWVNPSPNIRSVTQALLYSGVGLLEATNLSVGRGTNTPFEVIGAPWIEPRGLADALNRQGLRGVSFEPIWFTPTADVYTSVSCGGVRVVVTDREAIRPVTVALAVARTLRERHREQFRPESIQNLLVNRSTMWAFLRGEVLERLVAWAEMDRGAFLNRRASYLMYR